MLLMTIQAWSSKYFAQGDAPLKSLYVAGF